MTVSPLPAGLEAQTGLQAAPLLAPSDLILDLKLHGPSRELRMALDHAAVGDLVLPRRDPDRRRADRPDRPWQRLQLLRLHSDLGAVQGNRLAWFDDPFGWNCIVQGDWRHDDLLPL